MRQKNILSHLILTHHLEFFFFKSKNGLGYRQLNGTLSDKWLKIP